MHNTLEQIEPGQAGIHIRRRKVHTVVVVSWRGQFLSWIATRRKVARVVVPEFSRINPVLRVLIAFRGRMAICTYSLSCGGDGLSLHKRPHLMLRCVDAAVVQLV